jgi:hypothetical protein
MNEQKPTVYKVRPEQLGGQDVNDFLNQCIAKEFAGQEYFIVNESVLDRVTPEFPTQLRKIKAYSVNVNGAAVALYFDITEVQSTYGSSWLGGSR